MLNMACKKLPDPSWPFSTWQDYAIGFGLNLIVPGFMLLIWWFEKLFCKP